MITNQEAFRNGAFSMQGKIAAWLTTKGYFDLAGQILATTIPDYSEPEIMRLGKKND